MEAMTSSSYGTLSKILILRNRSPWGQATEPILAHLTPPILLLLHPSPQKRRLLLIDPKEKAVNQIFSSFFHLFI